jgi:dihydroxyacetone kinase
MCAHPASPGHAGAFMTALDMHGVSVSLLDLRGAGAGLLRLLDLSTAAPAWRPSRLAGPAECGAPAPAPAPADIATAADNGTVALSDTAFADNADLAAVVRFVCERLVAAEAELTELDSICGDGDCGYTVKGGAEAVVNKLKELEGVVTASSSSCTATAAAQNVKYANSCTYLADCAGAGMGGTLGAVTELLLRAMANYYTSAATTTTFATAMEKGMDAVTFYGGARVGMRTMLDALHPAVSALREGKLLELIRDCIVTFFTYWMYVFLFCSGGSIAAAADAASVGADATGDTVFMYIKTTQCYDIILKFELYIVCSCMY